MTRHVRWLLVTLTAITVMATAPVRAQVMVYDPMNYV